MKRTSLAILALICCLCAGAKAPKWLKKVRKAQVTVIAFDKEGNPKEAQGAFVDAQGTVLTEYDIFRGATKAIVIDATGCQHDVHRILGASSMYNVIKLSVNKNKSKSGYMELDTVAVPEGNMLYILPTSKADKSVPCTEDSVTCLETFKDKYHYYTLSKAHNQRLANCPVTNSEGRLIGLLQMATDNKKGSSYVMDANYAAQLRISPMDANNADLKAVNIPKALPLNATDATSFIFLAGTRDSSTYLQYVEDFLKAYPDSTIGYVMKAEALAEYQRLDEAEKVYKHALQIPSIATDEIHYSWAKMLYALNLNPHFKGHPTWTMERALEEAKAAEQAHSMPIYRKTIADCLFTLKQYEEAKTTYLALTQTNLRNPDLFLYAAQCIQMQTPEKLEEMIALQDSALACYNKPYPSEAAPILLMRGNMLAKIGKYRQAITDLIVYEKLYKGILSAEFYYQREQLALKSRVYPTALNDIAHAIRLNPDEPVFRAELAAICYRIGRTDDAIDAANLAIAMDPKFADAYRILGVCYNKKGNKAQAIKNLQKAIELGDTIAQDLLKSIK